MSNAYLLRRFGATLPTQYVTDFNFTENPLSNGGVWRTPVNFYKQPQTTPGKCFSNGATDNFDDALGQLVMPSLGDNYEIEAVIFRQSGYTPSPPDTSHECGLYSRLNIDNSNPANTLVRGYEFLIPFDSNSAQVVAWLAVNHAFPDNFNILSPTILNGGLQPAQNGDVFKVRSVGSTFDMFQNGTQILTITDTTWTSGGGPGLGFFPRTGATPSSFCWASWRVNKL